MPVAARCSEIPPASLPTAGGCCDEDVVGNASVATDWRVQQRPGRMRGVKVSRTATGRLRRASTVPSSSSSSSRRPVTAKASLLAALTCASGFGGGAAAAAAAAEETHEGRLRMENTASVFEEGAAGGDRDTCSADLIRQCVPCCEERESRYDCSANPGLSALTPGMYSGMKVNYLSYLTAVSSPNFPVRAAEFEACTGGKIVIADAENVWKDPIADLGTRTARGFEFYDGYFMSYSHFPEASALGLAEHLNERIREDNDRLKWEDVLPKVKAMGEYRMDGKTNLDFLMYDGDFFVPIIRLDLLEKHSIPLPNTWEDVVNVTKFFNGTDLNDDGDPNDFGFCHFPRLGAGAWDWWWPEALYSTWATHGQTDGMAQGFFFDDETFEPRIDAGFRQAAKTWKELWLRGSDGCNPSIFATGRCAVGFAPPGCWKGIFLDPDGVSRKDENGTVVWRPTMKNGDYAEPYRFRPFGSLTVVDQTTGGLVECTEATCPLAEAVPPRGHLGSGRDIPDRADAALPPSPHAGKLINRAPFYWSGGLGTLIRKSSPEAKKDMMWDFFVYTNSPDTSRHDVANYASWLDSWRRSQLEAGDVFIGAGWSTAAYEEHRSVMEWALSADSNGALNLRIPGLARYTRDVVGERMGKYIAGEMDLDQLTDEIRDGWRDVTESMGKLNQLEIYRAALGNDELSEYDLCRLHRALMDEKDPSLCRRYDVKSDENFVATVVVAVLVPIFVVGLLVVSAWCVMVTRSDSVWSVKSSELHFGDPPEVLGRGTFGLVLLAEYRGTQVAVKRVIPPKVGKQRKSEFKTKLFGWGDGRVSDDEKTAAISDGSFNFHNDDQSEAGHNSRQGTDVEAGVSSMSRIDDMRKGYKSGTTARTSVSSGLTANQPDAIRRKRLSWDSKVEVFSGMAMRRSSSESQGVISGGYSIPLSASSVNSNDSNGRPQPKTGRDSILGMKFRTGSRFATLMNSCRKRDEYSRLKADFVVEMRHLSKLRHPCITTVMGAVISMKAEPLLVMEYMDHGSLYDLLHNDTYTTEGEVLLPILRDIAQGVRFLHASTPQVIHGDLKAQNILVDSKFRAKVADFGLSQKKQVGVCGTPFWMAPELLRFECQNTAASDVYSFGIILYEVYSRSDPYEGEDYDEVIRLVCDKTVNKRPPIPMAMPSEVATLLMSNCLHPDPEERPSFDELDLLLKRFQVANVEPGTSVFSMQNKKMRDAEEAERNASLLYEVFPKHVAEALSNGRKVEPEHHSCVTIFFSDIVGYTNLCSSMSPMKISDMLDRLYFKFDSLSHKHNVFKVETIGDSWMGCTNLSKGQDDHAKRVADFSLDVMKAADETLVDLDDPTMGFVQIRVGFHSGPVLSNVVGTRLPKYSIFGDTVNTASRMESYSHPGRIQCSSRSADLLKKQAPDLRLQCRGEISIKGKGEMETYWVLAGKKSKTGILRKKSTRQVGDSTE